MKKLTLITILFMVFTNLEAQKYLTRNGYISFYSSTPLEDIKADNNQVASVLDMESGEIVFQVLMRSFSFKKKLMEEHFNENYVESEKYPKAEFRGKIKNPENIRIKNGELKEVIVEGELSLHGVTRNVSSEGTIEKNGDNLIAKSVFILKPEDYDIEIPSVVRDKIAKEIEVTVDMRYEKM